jgi:hypothetical protein
VSDSDLQELRAALIQLAKTLETERACVLRIIRVLERNMDEPVTIPQSESILQIKTGV